MPIWKRVVDYLLEPRSTSIDDVVDYLLDLGLVVVPKEYHAEQSVRDLVFAILGWSTMLYRPDFDTTYPRSEFVVVDEMQGHHGEGYVRHAQVHSSAKRNLSDFLLGFGIMLPPRNFCAFDDVEDRKVFDQVRRLSPEDVEAYLLAKVCGIKFQWVDCLSCHLELDKTTNTLFLYRYPSFCVTSLQESGASVLHRCASDASQPTIWAKEQDVVQLMEEILLSYRLLFGQSRRSRKLFRKLRPFFDIPRQGHDPLLSELCGAKAFLSPEIPQGRQDYDVTKDFPHLRGRLARLCNYASSKKPRSLAELWRDHRDSANWLTFWAVILFGSIGLLLAFIQSIFQIMQWAQGL